MSDTQDATPNDFDCPRCGDDCHGMRRTAEFMYDKACDRFNAAEQHAADYLRRCAKRYPADMFPSHADGGDTTGNAGAAARHVLTIAADAIENGERHA